REGLTFPVRFSQVDLCLGEMCTRSKGEHGCWQQRCRSHRRIASGISSRVDPRFRLRHSRSRLFVAANGATFSTSWLIYGLRRAHERRWLPREVVASERICSAVARAQGPRLLARRSIKDVRAPLTLKGGPSPRRSAPLSSSASRPAGSTRSR